MTELRVKISDRVNPGVVYTTFHHTKSKANAVTSDLSDWATNCPEYKVTAVDVIASNGPQLELINCPPSAPESDLEAAE
jgi:formate dehydrogenase major subunit